MDKDKLKKAIKDSGYKKTHIAKLLGISATTLSKWQSGSKIPTTKHELIASTLNVPLEGLT